MKDDKQAAADLQWAEIERAKPHPGKRPPKERTTKDAIMAEFDRLTDGDFGAYVPSLNPPPADPRVAHPARSRLRVVKG